MKTMHWIKGCKTWCCQTFNKPLLYQFEKHFGIQSDMRHTACQSDFQSISVVGVRVRLSPSIRIVWFTKPKTRQLVWYIRPPHPLDTTHQKGSSGQADWSVYKYSWIKQWNIQVYFIWLKSDPGKSLQVVSSYTMRGKLPYNIMLLNVAMFGVAYLDTATRFYAHFFIPIDIFSQFVHLLFIDKLNCCLFHIYIKVWKIDSRATSTIRIKSLLYYK